MDVNQAKFSEVGITTEELLEQSYYRILYKGKDQASGQPVLVHHWPTALIKTAEAQGQFSQGISRFQQLAHPSILPILKVHTHDRGVSLVSRYPSQGSLQARLNQHPFQPLPFYEAYTIIRQVGQALHHAHQQQIFHGSLTPWAVFFHDESHIAVTSFHFPGILAALPNYQPLQDQRLPRTWYMAPEQFDGVIDEQTDQYALGCLAYALLTGRVPLAGYTHRTLVRKHRSEVPRSLMAYNSQIPLYVEEAVLQALAKQPEQRYAHMQDFLHALEAPTHFAPHVQEQSPTAADASLRATVVEKSQPLSPRTTVVEKFQSLPPMQTLSRQLSSGHYSKNPFHTLFAEDAQKDAQMNSTTRWPLPLPLIMGLVPLIMLIVLGSIAFAEQPHKVPLAVPSTPGGIAHQQPTATPILSAPAPRPTPGGNSCRVNYEMTNQVTLNGSSGGFSASIIIINTSSSSIHGWQLVFSYTQGQQIVSSINAYASQQGQQVLLSNMSNDATIDPGQSLTVTVAGTWAGSDPSPAAFALNNTRCQ